MINWELMCAHPIANGCLLLGQASVSALTRFVTASIEWNKLSLLKSTWKFAWVPFPTRTRTCAHIGNKLNSIGRRRRWTCLLMDDLIENNKQYSSPRNIWLLLVVRHNHKWEPYTLAYDHLGRRCKMHQSVWCYNAADDHRRPSSFAFLTTLQKWLIVIDYHHHHLWLSSFIHSLSLARILWWIIQLSYHKAWLCWACSPRTQPFSVVLILIWWFWKQTNKGTKARPKPCLAILFTRFFLPNKFAWLIKLYMRVWWWWRMQKYRGIESGDQVAVLNDSVLHDSPPFARYPLATIDCAV